MLGFSAGDAAKEQATEAKFDSGLSAAQQRRLAEADVGQGQSGRLTPRQAERRLDAGAVQELGLGRPHRDLPRALPDAPGREAGAPRRSPLRRQAARAGHPPATPLPASPRASLPPYLAFQGRRRRHPRRRSTPTTACRTTTRRWSAPGSTCAARSSSPATAGGWRGLKPQLAQEHGAIGCLIYSDPADDGYGPADPYPKGGSRPPDGRAARVGGEDDDLRRRSAHAGASAPRSTPSV